MADPGLLNDQFLKTFSVLCCSLLVHIASFLLFLLLFSFILFRWFRNCSGLECRAENMLINGPHCIAVKLCMLYCVSTVLSFVWYAYECACTWLFKMTP